MVNIGIIFTSLLINQVATGLVSAPCFTNDFSSNMTKINIINDKWRITNDDVMGGLSQGNIQRRASAIVFSGNLSTKNNGGFSSVFMPLNDVSQNLSTIAMTVIGDGNLYQLRFRRYYQGYLISYKLPFQSIANQTTNHQFKLAQAQATFRGSTLNNAPPLTSESIVSIGLLISSEKSTEFSITLHRIGLGE